MIISLFNLGRQSKIFKCSCYDNNEIISIFFVNTCEGNHGVATLAPPTGGGGELEHVSNVICHY